MATRFYFPTTGTPDVEPNPSASWGKTDGFDRITLVTSKISSAFGTKAITETSATSGYKVLFRQYIVRIGVVDFSSVTAKSQFRYSESDAGANAYQYIICRVLNGSTLAERFSDPGRSGGQEFVVNTLTNRQVATAVSFGGAVGSSTDGDYLVIELGAAFVNTDEAEFTATVDLGDNSGSDLPTNSTETAQYCPWIEFTNDIPLYGAAAATNVINMII